MIPDKEPKKQHRQPKLHDCARAGCTSQIMGPSLYLTDQDGMVQFAFCSKRCHDLFYGSVRRGK